MSVRPSKSDATLGLVRGDPCRDAEMRLRRQHRVVKAVVDLRKRDRHDHLHDLAFDLVLREELFHPGIVDQSTIFLYS